jgi:MFS superfamily sulfate permease-like transporter
MGYTRIAGTPVVAGLYTILIPMAVFALFGSSRRLVVGADSATAVIMAGGLSGLAASGTPEYMALCSFLAVLAAVFIALARIIRLGFLADFLSRTVLIGFLTGVGIQVACHQIGGMLGLPGEGHGAIGRLMQDIQHIRQINAYAMLTAGGVLIVTLGSRMLSGRIPGPLIAVALAIGVSWTVDLKAHGIALLGEVPSGFPTFALPDVALSRDLLTNLLPTAFSVFVVILAQSAATSRAYAGRYDESFSENIDLVGLSLANLAAGLTGAFVVNGSPTKTQMVDGAGGSSQLAQITASLVVLLVLLFLTKPLEFLPEAALCAVVFLIGVELIDFNGMRKIFRERRAEFRVAVLTSVTVILAGVEQGILLAMFLSLVSHTRHGYRPKNSVVVTDPLGGWKTRPIESRSQLLPGLLAYRFNHGMYYANAGILWKQVTRLAREAEPSLVWFGINAAAVDDVDFTAAATLRSLYGFLRERDIRLVFYEISPEVYAQLKNSGIPELVGDDAFYATAGEMVAAYRQMTESGLRKDTSTTNISPN